MDTQESNNPGTLVRAFYATLLAVLTLLAGWSAVRSANLVWELWGALPPDPNIDWLWAFLRTVLAFFSVVVAAWAFCKFVRQIALGALPEISQMKTQADEIQGTASETDETVDAIKLELWEVAYQVKKLYEDRHDPVRLPGYAQEQLTKGLEVAVDTRGVLRMMLELQQKGASSQSQNHTKDESEDDVPSLGMILFIAKFVKSAVELAMAQHAASGASQSHNGNQANHRQTDTQPVGDHFEE